MSGQHHNNTGMLTKVSLTVTIAALRAILPICHVLFEEALLPFSDPPFFQSPYKDLRRTSSTDFTPSCFRAWIWACGNWMDIDKEVELDERIEPPGLSLKISDDLKQEECQ